MAESRHRHKHPHHAPRPALAENRQSKHSARKAGLILAIFIGVLGLAVGFFANGTTTGVIVGGLAGLVLGFLLGSSLDRAAEKRKL